jgi:hypothetical protein
LRRFLQVLLQEQNFFDLLLKAENVVPEIGCEFGYNVEKPFNYAIPMERDEDRDECLSSPKLAWGLRGTKKGLHFPFSFS